MKSSLKKIFTLLACLVLCLCLIPVEQADAAQTVASGKCGTNATWTYDSDGVLSINGSGSMADYQLSGGNDPRPYGQYLTLATKIVVNNGITRIGDSAFSGFIQAASVHIADSVTTIGTGAFLGSGIQTLTIPASVKTISSEAFELCTSLREVEINITGNCQIESRAFGGCSNLKKVLFGSGYVMLSDRVFAGCSALEELWITGGAHFPTNSYTNTQTGEVADPVFLTVPADLIIHDAYANSGTNVQAYAQKWGIPYSWSGFCGVEGSNLRFTMTSKNNEMILTISGNGRMKDYPFQGTYMQTTEGIPWLATPTKLIVESGVTSIGDHAFLSCPLTSVTLPSSLTNIGKYAFLNCNELKSITIPSNVTMIEQGAFESSGLTDITIPSGVTTIATDTFSDCKSLKNVNISTGVEIIDDYAFTRCDALTSVTIPSTVTSIGTEAFYICSQLSNITIPSSVTSIGENAFYNCTGLTRVNVNDIASWCKTYFGNQYANPLVFAGDLYLNGSRVTNLVIPSGVSAIGNGAFLGCKSISSISFPASLTGIGHSAFSGCSGLTRVTIPSSVKSIGPGAFASCTGLTDITIPSSITSIEAGTFSGCNSLTGITIPTTVKTIGASAFSGCSGLTRVTIPSNVTSIGEGAFSACSGLTDITIPSGVPGIEAGTFYNCGGLTTVSIPSSVTSIGTDAFSGCSSLTDVVYGGTQTQWNAVTKGENNDSLNNATIYFGGTMTYSVFYDANGGTGAPSTQTEKKGASLAISSDKPTRENTAAESYTVTLNANGGNVSPTSLTAERTTNYTFETWNTKADGTGTSYSSGASYTANTSVTLYAQWTDVTTTSSVTLPTPFRSGYTFEGWGMSSGASSGVTGNYTPDGNVMLYAVWKQLYPITYDANGGTGAPENQTKEQGSTLTLSSTVPVRASTSDGSYELILDANGGDVNPGALRAERTIEYTFREWNTKADGSGTSYAPGAKYTADESVTLYAQWSDTHLTASVSLPTPTREGYAFKGWGMNSGAASGVMGSYTPDGNETLIACWNALYLVEYDANSGSDAPLTQVKEQGIPLALSSSVPTHESVSTDYIVTLDANGGSVIADSPRAVMTTRYTFREWNTKADGSGTSYAQGTLYSANENVTLYAQWDSSSSTTSVTLPTPSRNGYIFMGWSENSEDATGITGSYTPSDHVTLYALWRGAEKYTVTFNANGGSGAPGTQIKEEQKNLILPAAIPTRIDGKDVSYTVTLDAKGGTVNPERLTADNMIAYTFQEWNTEADGSGTGYAPGAKYTADESVTLYARWNSSYSAASVDLPLPVRNGYTFKGWSASSGTTNGMTGSYTPTTSVTLYAIWEKNTILDSGTWDNLQWELDNHYNLTISGTGAMKKLASATGDPYTDAWRKYKTSIRNVVIEPGVSTVGDYAFYGCSSLMSVTIPDGVTSIGDRAFYQCSKLTGIRIPQTVLTIKMSAFYNCTSLSEVTMQNGVTSIGSYAFYGCSALTTLILPSSVTSLDYGAFALSGLTNVTIPKSMTSMGERAFYKCSSLYNLIILDGATSIGSSAFYNCTALTHVTIPGSVKSFGGYAFQGCTSLESVSIQEGVTKVATYAFKDCSKLTCVEIPASVASIAQGAFPSSCGLSEVYFGGSESEWSTVTISSGNEALQGAVMHYNVYPEQLIASGQWGSLQWKLDHYDTLTISGMGEMNALSSSADSQSSDAWRKYASLISEVVIEPGVSSIGDYAFYGCSSLTTITIPDSVTVIGGHTFDQCTILTNVTIPGSVAVIGNSAFSDCTAITDVSIQKGVTSIGDDAFSGCIGLTVLNIPDSVTDIGSRAFSNCSALTEVSLPGSLLSIGNGAFKGCSGLANIQLPENLTRIGECAFEGCVSLSSLVVPGSVKYFGGSAFAGCTALETVSIRNGVTGIDGYAFAGCVNLTKLEISSSVTSIGDALLSGCDSLTELHYSGSENEWAKVTVGQNNERLRSITIHFDMPIIIASGEWNLGEINGPSFDMYLYPVRRNSVGSWSLDDCGKLTISGTGYMPDFNRHYDAVEHRSFTDAPWGINIKSVIIKEGINGIGAYAFYGCQNLTGAMIAPSMTYIGRSAFEDCIALTEITIPEGVTAIGSDAFSGCTSLTRIRMPSSVNRINGEIFYGCGITSAGPAGTGADYEFEGWEDSIPGFAFSGCRALRSVTIPETVTEIGDSAFAGCGITEITFPPKLTYIGYEAFTGCDLTSVTIPSCIQIIDYAFSGCSSLTSVSIPNGVKEIWDHAFSDCTALINVSIPNELQEIGDYAFSGCSALTDLTISDSVINIGKDAFSGCASLTSVTIPANTTSISDGAFAGCSGLTSVTVPSSLTSIGRAVFYKCSGLTDIYYEGSQEQWAAISKGTDNDPLSSATIHYNYVRLPAPDLILPAFLKIIEEEAFAGGAFVYVKLPEGTESIHARAFADCPNLKYIYIPESTTTIDPMAFENVVELTILGKAGSVAESFASSLGYSFIEKE